MKNSTILTKEEKEYLAELINEKVTVSNKQYDKKILSIQKKLNLYPRKELWVRCGVLYETIIEHEGAVMKWIGPIVKCCEKVERPYSDANTIRENKPKDHGKL